MVDTGSQTRINHLESTPPKSSKIFVATLLEVKTRSSHSDSFSLDYYLGDIRTDGVHELGQQAGGIS